MTENCDVKIFLSYHKDCDRLKSKVLTPIHVGRAISSESARSSLKDLIGDDTGDNISEKNATFCELTAQYWVWKNCKTDYVGFFHYRRHLFFNETDRKENMWGVLEYPYITDNYVSSTGLNDDTIATTVVGREIITVRKWDVTNAGSSNNYDHYKSSSSVLHIEDYDQMNRILIDKYPDYAEDVKKYNKSKFGYYTNIFIMKWDIFDDYCHFLFDILFELEKNVDISNYNVQEKRIFGYLSEWMFGIFLTHYERVVKKPILELPRTFIAHPEIENDVLDYCSTCDDNYVRHLGVFLTSVRDNKGPEKIRHWILSDGIKPENKKILESIGTEDYSVRIVEFDHLTDSDLERSLKTNPHLSMATYNKLFLVENLPLHIHRLLYMDTDMVCKDSLYDLYKTDFEDNVICGVKDVLEKSNTERLKIEKYINAGVILINVDLWRVLNVRNQLVDYLVKNVNNRKAIFYHDQDVINATLSKKIKYVDSKWDAQTSSYGGCEGQNEIGKTAAIIHFISDRKPWLKDSGNPFESEYAYYLERSPWKSEPIYIGTTKICSKRAYQKISDSVTRVFVNNFKFNILNKLLLKIDVRAGNNKNICKIYDDSYSDNSYPKNEIFSLLKSLAKAGNPHAMVRVARAYKDTHGVSKDLKKSFYWFRKTAATGVDWVYDEYIDNLIRFYDESYGVEDQEYWSDLLKELEPYAEAGNPHAMVRVARAYKDTHGVSKDLKKSFYWFRKTAATGVDWVYDEYIDNLIRFYDESYGVEDQEYWSDLLKELEPYAEAGNPHAMVRVARAYNMFSTPSRIGPEVDSYRCRLCRIWADVPDQSGIS